MAFEPELEEQRWDDLLAGTSAGALLADGLEATDLLEVLDPHSLESELAIDLDGQFVEWLRDEASGGLGLSLDSPFDGSLTLALAADWRPPSVPMRLEAPVRPERKPDATPDLAPRPADRPQPAAPDSTRGGGLTRLERRFDATALLRAHADLTRHLGDPGAPVLVLLGLAAVRSLVGLGGFGSVALAELAEGSLVVSGSLRPGADPRAALLGARDSDPVGNDSAGKAGLLVADLSGLDVDGLDLDLDEPHLLLTEARGEGPGANPSTRAHGRLVLKVPTAQARAGAAFLAAVAGRLERPLGLLV